MSILNKGTVTSLSSPEATDPLKRRLIKGLVATNGPPNVVSPTIPDTAKAGVNTKGRKWLHLIAKLRVAGSATWRLWVFTEMSQEWCIDTEFGTAGTVTLALADIDNPQWNVREIAGVERIYVEVDGFAGGAEIDVWAGTVGGFGSADG